MNANPATNYEVDAATYEDFHAALDELPKDAAILTVDGEVVGQARLSRPQDVELLKAHAREHRAEGRAVTVRKGAWLDVMTAICGVCGEGRIRYSLNEDQGPVVEMMGAECPKCYARVGGCDGRIGTIGSWMSAREIEAANDWYDAQMFGADGGF